LYRSSVQRVFLESGVVLETAKLFNRTNKYLKKFFDGVESYHEYSQRKAFELFIKNNMLYTTNLYPLQNAFKKACDNLWYEILNLSNRRDLYPEKTRTTLYYGWNFGKIFANLAVQTYVRNNVRKVFYVPQNVNTEDYIRFASDCFALVCSKNPDPNYHVEYLKIIRDFVMNLCWYGNHAAFPYLLPRLDEWINSDDKWIIHPKPEQLPWSWFPWTLGEHDEIKYFEIINISEESNVDMSLAINNIFNAIEQQEH
jgi:hypothetical protein